MCVRVTAHTELFASDTSVTKWGGGSQQHQLGVPLLSWILALLGVSIDPTGKGSFTPDPLLHKPSQVPGCHLYFRPTGSESRFPQPPPQVQKVVRSAHRVQGITFTGLLERIQ